MEVIVWRSGEKYEKSNKNEKPLLDSNNEIIHNVAIRGEYTTKKKNRVNTEKLEEIMGRRMISQRCQNPFLTKDFSDVLSDQERFLIPQNSNVEVEVTSTPQ